MMSILKTIGWVCAVATLAGCADYHPIPVVQMRLTEQVIAQSRTIIDDQDAPLLQQAQDKFTAAETALREDKRKQARLLAEQAELDARLAEADVLLIRTEEQLQALNKQIETLRTALQEAD